MEYYEDDFIQFEDFAKQTGLRRSTTESTNDSHSDFILAKFATYEKWMKVERRREWKKFVKQQEKKAKKNAAPQSISKNDTGKASVHDKQMIQVRH